MSPAFQMSGYMAIAVLALGLVIYFSPSIAAYALHYRRRRAVLAVNVLSGPVVGLIAIVVYVWITLGRSN